MKAKLLNHRFSLFSLLALFMVLLLITPYLLFNPKAVKSQSEPEKVVGLFKVEWKLTDTCKERETVSYQESGSDYKRTEEYKKDLVLQENGEMKGTILGTDLDSPDHHTVFETPTISVNASLDDFWGKYFQKSIWCKTGVKVLENYQYVATTIHDIKVHPDFKPHLGISWDDDLGLLYDFNIFTTNLPTRYTDKNNRKEVYTYKNGCGHQETRTSPSESFDNSFSTRAMLYNFNQIGSGTYGKLNKLSGNIYTASNTVIWPYKAGGSKFKDQQWSYEGTLTIEYKITYEHHPTNLEVLISDPDNYEDWMPEAASNENTKGNDITIKADLRKKGRPDDHPGKKGKFIFDLVDTSHEKGVCLNVPREAAKGDIPDMKFEQSDNPSFTISNNGQTATSKKSDISAQVKIASFDWGGRTRLRVKAILDEEGTEVPGHLKSDKEKIELVIPKDDNKNSVADAWEEKEQILDKNYPAEWNDIDVPAGQAAKGDGISLYERYRGFEFESNYNPTNDPKLRHERLKTKRKYVFIYDPAELVLSSAFDPITRDMNFIQISGFAVRFVAEDQWTGSGKFSEDKRIVNFNKGTANIADQHGIEVRANFKSSLINPMTEKALPDDPKKITLGMTWPDKSAPPPKWDSPANIYLVDIFMINLSAYYDGLLLNHTLGLPQFAGKKYEDMTAEEQKQVEIEADKYQKLHMLDEYNPALLKEKTITVSHELGHALSIDEHIPETAGSKECVMRYFEPLTQKLPNDRFELHARDPWPDSYCTESANTAGGKGCKAQIKVTDKGKKK